MSLVGFRGQNHRQQVGKRGANPLVDDRQTAPEVFAPLQERFGFTIDVAASPRNRKVKRYFAAPDAPATTGCMWDHPDECGAGGCAECPHDERPVAVDGLAQPWAHERVWCNPPYSSIEPWVAKANQESADGCELIVMLLPANRTEQGWWQREVEPYRDKPGGICVEFLAGRMRFIAPDALEIKPNERPPFGVCLLIWGAA